MTMNAGRREATRKRESLETRLSMRTHERDVAKLESSSLGIAIDRLTGERDKARTDAERLAGLLGRAGTYIEDRTGGEHDLCAEISLALDAHEKLR